MSIKNITTDDLRRMNDSEGIIFQGCGGDPQEWVDGINDMLTESKVLLDGTRFSDVYRFENNGGTWLTDFVENDLGGFENERVKPDCALISENGNIFHLTGKAAHTLKQNGMSTEADEMIKKVMRSGSYEEALGVIGDYVNITDGSESEDFDEGQGMSL